MYQSIEKYISHIRNQNKQAYARQYFTWLCNGSNGPEPISGKISYMAAQAVRLQIMQMFVVK